ncbi:MAG: ribosomal protein methyltransferase [Acidimicrobiales bacterium]|nr:ribosomal protein methyltransferase [Acidimicrobiales bacterium]
MFTTSTPSGHPPGPGHRRRYGSVVPTDGWTTVVVKVDPSEVEAASALLWAHGAAAIEERSTAGPRALLLAGYEHPGPAADAADGAEAAGYAPVRVEPVTDDGADAWREFAVPERAGRWWLVPAWLEPPTPGDGERLLLLDPGRTFGSGSHPTTRLVAALLDDLVHPGTSVLDVGAGSGVLSVIAALLGATPVVAIDVDPASPHAVRDNAARNAVPVAGHGAIDASTRSLAEVVSAAATSDEPSTFDLLLANLLAPVIADLSADLVAAVAPGGTLVVSGLLADRWQATTDRLAPLTVVQVTAEDGWVAVTLRRQVTTAAQNPRWTR